jgi:hypothetical protein
MKNNQESKLVLLKDLGMRYATETAKNKKRFGLYKCHCGKEFETRTDCVKTGNTKSCGCVNGINHNLSNHVLYKTWYGMIQRCTNPNHKSYKHYGLKGITVCDEWLSTENFINDMSPSHIVGLTLDRINNNGNYCKDNCRWTTQAVQTRNTRLINSRNKSGYRGVSWSKNAKRWASAIVVSRKQIWLGNFIDKLEAAKAYDNYIITNNLEHTKNLI